MSTKAELFNRKAVGVHSQPERIMDSLKIKAGDTVLDLGAGGGYFSLKFSEAVGAGGMVYAADSDAGMIDYIGTYIETLQLKNIVTLKTKGGVPHVPKGSCDLVFVRNVFHHIANPTLFFTALSDKLKAGGRIAVVEYKKGGGLSFSAIFGHGTSAEQIVELMACAGYVPLERFDYLKKQSFIIFEKAL